MLTTLEKATQIVKDGSCDGFWCSSDGAKCPVFVSCGYGGSCGDNTGCLPQSCRDIAKAYMKSPDPLKEGDLVWVSDTIPNTKDMARVFLHTENGRYVTVAGEEGNRAYKNNLSYKTNAWQYAEKTGERVEKIKEVNMKIGDKVEVISGALIGYTGKVCGMAHDGDVLVDFGVERFGFHKGGVDRGIFAQGGPITACTGNWVKPHQVKVLPTLIYGQTCYDKEGNVHTFITYTPDSKMMATFCLDLDNTNENVYMRVYKDIFYAEDPTIIKKEVKEMTIADVEALVGCSVKIVK